MKRLSDLIGKTIKSIDADTERVEIRFTDETLIAISHGNDFTMRCKQIREVPRVITEREYDDVALS